MGKEASLEAMGLRMVWLPADEARNTARLGQALSLHRRTRFVVVCEASSEAKPSTLQALHAAGEHCCKCFTTVICNAVMQRARAGLAHVCASGNPAAPCCEIILPV